jgi:hypothetical protein
MNGLKLPHLPNVLFVPTARVSACNLYLALRECDNQGEIVVYTKERGPLQSVRGVWSRSAAVSLLVLMFHTMRQAFALDILITVYTFLDKDLMIKQVRRFLFKFPILMYKVNEVKSPKLGLICLHIDTESVRMACRIVRVARTVLHLPFHSVPPIDSWWHTILVVDSRL